MRSHPQLTASFPACPRAFPPTSRDHHIYCPKAILTSPDGLCNIIVMGTTSTRSIRAKETIWLVPAFPHLQADVSGSGLLWGILSLQCHRGCYGALVGSYPQVITRGHVKTMGV